MSPPGVPTFQVRADGSIAPATGHPARFCSPGSRDDRRREIVCNLRSRHEPRTPSLLHTLQSICNSIHCRKWNSSAIWLWQGVVFQALTTPSAFFDLRTPTCRQSVSLVNTSVGALWNDCSDHEGKVDWRNTCQVWRPACNGLEAEFELAHCRVNLGGGNHSHGNDGSNNRRDAGT